MMRSRLGKVVLLMRGSLGAAVTFLLRDDFTTADAAPIASPRTCEPGPGTLTAVDASSIIGIVSSQLSINGVAAAATHVYSAAQTRVCGRLLSAKIVNRTNNTTAGLAFGWEQPGTYSADPDYGYSGQDAINIRIRGGGIFDTFTQADNDILGLALRTTGCFYVAKLSGTWRLMWVSVATATNIGANLGVGATTVNEQYDDLRIADMAAPWATDDGLATQVLSGARSAGDTWTHEADHVSYATITTLPSALQIELLFRIQDATNFWQVTVDSTGALDLDEVVAGTPTQRGTSAAAVTAGERIVWIAQGSSIKVGDTVVRFNYSSAANFATETDGELETEGTGGSVSTIQAWPRTLSGAALTQLQTYAEAA